eukprot:PhM_4_TR13282/c2_g1_i4/m.36298
MRGRYDYHGADVMVLKKVESSADGGQVLMTRGTFDELRGHAEYPTLIEPVVSARIAHRNVRLEGLAEPVTLYNVLPIDLTARYFSGDQVVDSDSLLKGEAASSAGSGATHQDALHKSARHLTRVFIDAWPERHHNALLAMYCAALSVPTKRLSHRCQVAFVMNAIDQRVLSTVAGSSTSGGCGTSKASAVSFQSQTRLSAAGLNVQQQQQQSNNNQPPDHRSEAYEIHSV